jgi:hypothetical protein
MNEPEIDQEDPDDPDGIPLAEFERLVSLAFGLPARTFRLSDGSLEHVFEAPATGEFPDEIDV